MPGFWTPCPGKRSAMGPARSMPMSMPSGPLQECCAPVEARTKTREKHVVSLLDAAVANRLLKRKRDRCARRVAVLVDVHRDSVDRESYAAGRRVDDSEVGLVRHPQVDLVQPDPCRLAHLSRLADEDVNRELEHVGSHHVDERRWILRRIRTLLDVAGCHLCVAAAVRAEAPAEKARTLWRGRYDRRAGAVAEDHGGASVGVVEHPREDFRPDHEDCVRTLR